MCSNILYFHHHPSALHIEFNLIRRVQQYKLHSDSNTLILRDLDIATQLNNHCHFQVEIALLSIDIMCCSAVFEAFEMCPAKITAFYNYNAL